MMPDEANVVPLANRILDAKAELAKKSVTARLEEPLVTDKDRYISSIDLDALRYIDEVVKVNIIQRTPSDLGEVH